MVKNITDKGIDSIIIAKNSFHLTKFTLAFLNYFSISIFSHNIIFTINQPKSIFIKVKLDNSALVINRSCCSILNRLCHIININIITKYFTSAAVF